MGPNPFLTLEHGQSTQISEGGRISKRKRAHPCALFVFAEDVIRSDTSASGPHHHGTRRSGGLYRSCCSSSW